MLRSSALLAVLLAAACAGPEAPGDGPDASPLGRLPASYQNTPSCGGCLAVTLTLRRDGSYLARERLGASEFYDFGGWRESRDERRLHLDGGRDLPRSYVVRSPDTLDAQTGTQGGDLRRLEHAEPLRGPFRLIGLYDGAEFKECRTGLRFAVAESRAAAALQKEYLQRERQTALVSVDARFEQTRAGELLVVQRTATILNERGCPG